MVEFKVWTKICHFKNQVVLVLDPFPLQHLDNPFIVNQIILTEISSFCGIRDGVGGNPGHYWIKPVNPVDATDWDILDEIGISFKKFI